jgi:hypothetical protein
MAGADRFTEFRVMQVPVGAGVVVQVSRALGATVAALGLKFLGTTTGAYTAALAQLLAAWLLRRPAVDRWVGVATADLGAAVLAGQAIDSVFGVEATVRGLIASTTGMALAQGPAAPAAVRPAAAPVAQFRSAVHQKAALTRL